MTEQVYIAIQMAKRRSQNPCMYVHVDRSQFPTNHNKPSNDMRLYNFPPTSQSAVGCQNPQLQIPHCFSAEKSPVTFRDNAFDIQQRSRTYIYIIFPPRGSNAKSAVCLLKGPETTPSSLSIKMQRLCFR